MTRRFARTPAGRTATAAACAALFFLLALLLAAPSVRAVPIWVDADGDGLPEPPDEILAAEPGDIVTVDIWVDSQSFSWTNFQVWLDRGPTLAFTDGAYLARGGNNFPFDNFTIPTATGIGGFGFVGQHGVSLLARLSLRKTWPGLSTLSFLIDPNDPRENFSLLGTRGGYFLFERGEGARWQSGSDAAGGEKGWGLVKGLYK